MRSASQILPMMHRRIQPEILNTPMYLQCWTDRMSMLSVGMDLKILRTLWIGLPVKQLLLSPSCLFSLSWGKPTGSPQTQALTEQHTIILHIRSRSPESPWWIQIKKIWSSALSSSPTYNCCYSIASITSFPISLQKVVPEEYAMTLLMKHKV